MLLSKIEVVFSPGFSNVIEDVLRFEVHGNAVYFLNKDELTFAVVLNPMIVRILERK